MDSRCQKKNYRDGSYLLVDSLNDIVVETTFLTGSAHILTAGTMSPLLFFVPIAFISNTLQLPDAAIFLISLLGVASLAEKMGIITDQLVHHTNQTIGALLNVSFGNATELIVAIFALKRKLYRLVQLSLLGSILINILFVLGMCFLVGGMKQKVQNFSKISSHLNATLLVSSLMAILFPTVLTLSGEESNMGELGFSRLTSVVLLVTYFAFLYFQVCWKHNKT
jgi:Ca2+:H+ antiporter